MKVAELYQVRFSDEERKAKARVWEVLCPHYFQDLIGPDQRILDLACGYGEFINNIVGRERHAIDINEESKAFLEPDIQFIKTEATNLSALEDQSIDVVFTSNFFEHLHSKTMLDQVFAEVLRVLAPGGRFVIMGPNIRFLYDKYWDFYDHHLALSDRSLGEGLTIAGYTVITSIAKFLPYTTKVSLPKGPFFVKLYLKFPLAWRFMGKQFLLVAQKPKS